MKTTTHCDRCKKPFAYGGMGHALCNLCQPKIVMPTHKELCELGQMFNAHNIMWNVDSIWRVNQWLGQHIAKTAP